MEAVYAGRYVYSKNGNQVVKRVTKWQDDNNVIL